MCYIIIRGELSIAVSFSLVIYYLLYVIIVISAKPEIDKEKDEEELEGLLMSNLEYSAGNEETSPLISQLAQDADRSSTGIIPHTTPITYYKRMNFWTADEIAKAFDVDSIERRDIPRLFRRNTDFFSVSSRLNSSISRALSIAPRSRIRSYSSPLVGESAGTLEVAGQGSRQSLWNAHPKFLRTNAPDMIFITNSEETMNLSASPSEISTTAEFEASSNFSDLAESAGLWELLFPGFSGFRKLTAMEKCTNLICAPLILPLILTIPVVTLPTTATAPMIIVSPPSESAASLGSSPVNYSQDILVSLQFFFIPILLLESIMDGMSCKPDIIWIILAGGLVSLISVAAQIATRRACLSWEIPGFTLLCALFGFMLALVWISIAATEVVDVLRALGVILGINEEIIGLTVFAMGNSLGDFVANLSVARMGYPTMAVSACFAGPMLNMMLGPGLAGVYLSLTRSEPIVIPSSRIMILSAVGVLITLVVYNIYVHTNRFYIDRRFGGFLIGVYFFGMAINLLLTYHHRGS
ncbi:hypothetical protein DSO57_1037004 [Entomophthora muscae]|uniref:Uncharacterized protein n=1 Tax=Entomophthora muscae TaxID=34485 RepID=A0ACC2SNH8_9FUNG|nr:hypothetical protein DSO57_1037004 [Entomophthora muscae]